MQQLLDKVKAQIDLFEKHKELSGENFNIFSIMSMENDEVFTHSAIIAELLSPKGSHSLGSKPLELFIEQFKEHFEKHFEEFNFTMDFENMISIKEENLISTHGNRTYDRLDIVVKVRNSSSDSPNIFCIENKIYAGEQEDQLIRYKSQYPKGILFYLTLDGSASKQVIENKDNEVYTAISYENDILNWIQECVKFAYDKPMVREVLNQYIYLIKKLTDQTTNEDMSKEIIKLINENFEASNEIHKNFEKALVSRQVDLLEKIRKNIVIDKIITKVEIFEKNNTKRLFIYFLNDYYLSFHFKSTTFIGMLLIGTSNLDNNKFSSNFDEFKKPNWKLEESDDIIYWKHYKEFLNSTDYLIKVDKKDINTQAEDFKEIAENLVKIIQDFNNFINPTLV